MNIFALDLDVKLCAEMHNDKHSIKMILEYNQLLCTAHRVLDGHPVNVKSKTNRNVTRWLLNDSRDSLLYSATHINHPSAVWTRQSKANYQWLHSLLVELCQEYTYRYGKIHKCQRDGLVDALASVPQNIPDTPFTQPTPAMPDDCKISGDSVASYRQYYTKYKQHLSSWNGKVASRPIPHWFVPQ